MWVAFRWLARLASMRRFTSLAAVFGLTIGLAWSQGQPSYDPAQGGYAPPASPSPEQTRPDQGVARISLINGDVSVRHGESGEVTAGAMNAPLMVQDRILTASSSRAEVQFDAANLVRVAANSEVRIADLQYGRAQIQLAIGTITLRVLRNSQYQIEIDLPSVGFRPTGPGVYRISVREDGSGDITVREGGGQVLTQGGSEDLKPGLMMMVRGTGQDTEYQVVNAPGLDDWDHWNQQRDGAFLQSRSAQYVGPDIYGTENLDQNGRWVQDPTYGNVWAPNVQPGWAPYQAGQWVWEDYYGWTWVSTDPWGWAPYHYGRWFYGPVGWAWYPGPLFGHRYWSPALVGFFGFGGRVSFGFGFARVGWVPLAPFEAVHAWWGRGYSRGAVFNTAVISNVYRNARVTNGVTAVGASEFGRRTAAYQRLSGSQVQNAGVVHGALPVAASRSSSSFGNRPISAARFPQTANRTFFGRPSGVAAPRASTAGGWSRFNGAAPQSSYQSPRSGWGAAAGASQAVRISPPIVRSYSSGSNRGGGTSAYRNTAPASRGNANSGSGRAPAASKAVAAPSRSSGGGHASGGGGHHR
jgi:hypothetical protein